MNDWNELTPEEKIQTFPERHPHPFKCALYLFIELGVSFGAIDLVMRQMGYLPIDVRQVSDDESLSFGAPTYAVPGGE